MRRILVVDDEAAITAVVADLLMDAGYVVSTARDGRQAWSADHVPRRSVDGRR